MNYHSLSRILYLLVVIGVFSLCFGLILFYFTYYTLNGSESSTFSSHSHTYQYVETNPLQKETRYGFAVLPQSILDDEYIFYLHEKSKNQIVISKLSDEKFECQGSCFCASIENHRRWTSTSVLSHGLSVILFALSASVARKIAEEAFRDNCVQHFSLACDPEEIFSEVSECSLTNEMISITKEHVESFFPAENEELGEVTDMSHEESSDQELRLTTYPWEGIDLDYECSGHCSQADMVGRDADEAINFIRNLGPLGCSELKVSGTVTSKFDEEYRGKYKDELYLTTKRQFLDQYLAQFCSERSKSEDNESFCSATTNDVSCKRKTKEDNEELFIRGLQHFRDEMAHIRTEFPDISIVNINFEDLYTLYGSISEWGLGELAEGSESGEEGEGESDRGKCFELMNVEIGFKYRGQGFSQRLLGEIEDWGTSQSDLRAIVLQDVQNPELRSYLGTLDYLETKESDSLALKAYETTNSFYKRIKKS